MAMAAFGAVLGPVALAWGLQHTSGTSASLMLTLEALFTALLAWFLYRETMDGRVWTAMLLLVWAHWPSARARLHAVHFNHRLRGAAADRDEAFCRRVCAAPVTQGRKMTLFPTRARRMRPSD